MYWNSPLFGWKNMITADNQSDIVNKKVHKFISHTLIWFDK